MVFVVEFLLYFCVGRLVVGGSVGCVGGGVGVFCGVVGAGADGGSGGAGGCVGIVGGGERVFHVQQSCVMCSSRSGMYRVPVIALFGVVLVVFGGGCSRGDDAAAAAVVGVFVVGRVVVTSTCYSCCRCACFCAGCYFHVNRWLPLDAVLTLTNGCLWMLYSR